MVDTIRRTHGVGTVLGLCSGIALLSLSLTACGPDKTAAYAGGAISAGKAGTAASTAHIAPDQIVLAEWPGAGIGDPPQAPAEAPLEAPAEIPRPEAPADAPPEAPVDEPPAMIPAPPMPLPHYDVIAERIGDRRDDMKTYFIVMDGVDPANDGFKNNVKQILRVVASVNRGTDFSAMVWDDLLAAQTEAAYRSAPDMFTEVQLEAKNARNERHLIASYQGGIETVGQPPAYVTSWFPHAGLLSPEVGMWVSSEVWRP